MKIAILGQVVREVLFDEVNFEKRSERRGVSYEDNWLKNIQGRGNSKCKCLVVRTWLVYLRSRKELSVAGESEPETGAAHSRLQRANRMGCSEPLVFALTAGFLGQK